MPPSPRVEPSGHGLIISADGELLTAAGALRGRESLQVQLFEGRLAEARVIAFDPDADLVLLQSPALPRTDAAPWATTPPTAGMLAVAVSHVGPRVAVAPVFVMAAPDADRRVRTTSGDLLPGTPLYTTAGEVFAIAAGDGDPSAALIAPAVARLRERIASGQARRGAIGVTFQPLDGLLLAAFKGDGVLVADVAPYGPADDAGIEPGDLVTAVGDTDVRSPDAARQAIAALAPQSTVTIQLLRAGKPLALEMTSSSALGLRIRQAPRVQEEPAPDAHSVLDPASRARADLRPHSRVLAINNTRVATTAEARTVLSRARQPLLVLYVEDERGRFFVALEPTR
jgi:hypothetical protein